ncbi:MAG: hypothetical protein Q9186_006094 [Xanthomendoza sp. 1 TL-2023]
MRKRYPPEDQLNAFLQTLQRAYFSRTWIIQEVVVASSSSLFCGDLEITWADFILAVKYFVNFDKGLIKNLNEDIRVDQVLLIDQDQNELSASRVAGILALMPRHRRLVATDPRDKVFALLDLTDPSCLDGLDVYTRFAVSHLQHTQSLDIMSVPRVRGQQGVQGLASWVPDWSIWNGTISFRWEELLAPTSLHLHFNAAAGTKASPLFSADWKILTLKGIMIDTVSRTSVEVPDDSKQYFVTHESSITTDLARSYPQGLLGLTETESWRSIGSAYDKSSIYQSTGEPMSEVYYQTIYGGQPTWPKDFIRKLHKKDIKAGRTNQFVHGIEYFRNRLKL